MSVIDAVKDVLEKNGGVIDGEDTFDGQDYVMVRRIDFDALTKAFLELQGYATPVGASLIRL